MSSTSNRIRVLLMLGGMCARCGDDDLSHLQIDHKNNDGHLDRDHRRYGGGRTDRVVRDIVAGRRGLDGLQALCGTCHHVKTYPVPEGWEDLIAEVRNTLDIA